MAITRRVARRHRRWRQKESKKRALEKLKRIEDEILGFPLQHRFIEWRVPAPFTGSTVKVAMDLRMRRKGAP